MLAALVPEQRREPGANLVDRLAWAAPDLFRAAGFPIDALHVIGQDHSGSAMRGGNGHFEWITLGLIRDRTNERQAGFRVVCSRAQHERWAPPRLLAARLRVECQPNKVTSLGDVVCTHQDSSPCGCPHSVSRWRFLDVIRETNSESSYLRRVGRKTMLPSGSKSNARLSPSLRRASLAIACGIRTARLFPHFETVVAFRICIYFEYTSEPTGDSSQNHLPVHKDARPPNRGFGPAVARPKFWEMCPRKGTWCL